MSATKRFEAKLKDPEYAAGSARAFRRHALKLKEENVRLRAAMESIRDAKEPSDHPAPDDSDWRYTALEMKRVATVVLKAQALT